MKILHTEASPGYGGQELRILRESEGMRERGHEVILAIRKGGGLVKPARKAGFEVYELPFEKKNAFKTFFSLCFIIMKHRIDLINTHSSLDAWLGGIAARLLRKKVIRTRHLSTPIRPGLNSRLLYNALADRVVTTCAEIVDVIKRQAKLPQKHCCSIPTGTTPLSVSKKAVTSFRASLGIKPTDCVAGTLCVLRGWKGVSDLLKAAKQLEDVPHLKWLIVGSGPSEEHFKEEWKEMGLQDKVVFTGYLSPPNIALAAMDIFLLLSHANEGVSQASLQAASLKKPLITTPTGGLKEVCLHEKTGLQVDVYSPDQVATAVKRLLDQKTERQKMGEEAYQLVQRKFTLSHTLDQMETLFQNM
ncbi:MAG: D-inositol-3-phosphate glycosyltransferase [Chlamydiales bacterium]|nr:D-inositol-3-phosphate glycosyltransferase [Chlamydiales bacterium]MCH9620491.1 D-inositol-3-phosphate glycosyltransferase [Chlamydiales bacterium]MCH9623476.1 D-inositol-3-phosphate glycosyltransferase [Chlamydiales bacterium]